MKGVLTSEDMFITSLVQNAGAETTLRDLTMGALFALAAITLNERHTLLCDIWPARMRMAKGITERCLRTLGRTSEVPQSSGSPAFTWTCQQLSQMACCGRQAARNSSSSLVTAGKRVISVTAEMMVMKKDVRARTLQVGM